MIEPSANSFAMPEYAPAVPASSAPWSPRAGGEMGQRTREYPWHTTPLGPLDTWPECLRVAVDLCLNSRFPMFVWWGPELINIHNDAYIDMIHTKHPAALGMPASKLWPEIWDVIGPQTDRVMKLGQATWNERQLLVTHRKGYPDEGYFTFSYSPIITADGDVGGLFCAVTDETARVQAEREREQLTRAIDAERAALASIIEHSPAFIAVLHGPTHIYQLVNQRYIEVAGQRDFIGKSVRDVLPEIAGQGFFELLDNVYNTGETFTGNELPIVLKRPDGQLDRRYMNFVYQPTRDPAGHITGIFVHGIDVTTSVVTRETLRHREEIYRASEERLAFALNAADLGTFYCPMPLGEIIWNDNCKKHFFLPPDAAPVNFDVFYSILHPDDREATRRAIQKAVFEHQPYDIEYRTVAPDGRFRWIRARGRAYYGSDGQPVRFDGVTLDITASKQAELNLAQSRDQMEVVVKGANVGVWYCPLPFNELHWDAKVKEHFHLPPDAQVTIDTFYQRIHPEDRESTRFAIESSIQQRLPYDIHYRTVSADGSSVKWIRARGRGFYDSAGNPTHFDGVTLDVTEQKHAEQALRESEARFRTMADSAPVLIWMADTAMACSWFNKPWLDFVGRSMEQEFGRGWLQNVHPEDLPGYLRTSTTSFDRREPFNREFRLRRHDGQWRWLLDHGTPRYTPEGLFTGYIGSCIDITDRKRVEDERHALLESERAARAEAEIANSAKDKFLAVLSHELRTPLSPVVMTIPSMELDPDMPAKFRDELTMIRRNIDLEVKLIDDLLDLSRVATGKMRLHVEPVLVHELLHHVLHSIRSDASSKSLTVESDLSATEHSLPADPARLQQVFWNLLRNAIKFTPDKGRITVGTAVIPDPKQPAAKRLQITFKDTGRGIAPEVLPRIFDAFEQGEVRMTRQFGGLGLGLAIARAVVEMHGGTITAASPGLNQGSTFTVELPLATQPTPAATPPPSAAPTRTPARQARILLIEDHLDTSRTIARILTMSNYSVKTAHSAAAALQITAAEPFDIVISDIGLPDSTGYELMRQLRNIPNLKGIALSGYGMDEDVRKSLDAGFACHLVKPVNITLLQTTINRLLAST